MTNQQGALQYADRDHTDLGSYYLRHVSAMTGEALHSKSAIAAELAHRDREIDRLQAENANLNAGYAAARLEIESLQARIKTMAEERADELMVAHLAGRSQAAQQPTPSAAQPAAEPITSGVADGAVWVRYDLADGLKEQAIKDKLIALGWTPPAAGAQPAPTPQADSQPAPVPDWLPFSKRMQIANRHGVKVTAEFNALVRDVIQTYLETHALRAARAPADSVLEDTERWTTEQEHAIRQGHEIAASDGYFEARPQIDSNDRRKVFQAGFERGWDAARKQGENHDH